MLLPAWEWAAPAPETGHEGDPNWLVRLISKLAWEFFQESNRGVELLGAGAEVVRSIRRHKKQLTTLGEDTFCLRQARSDRPAFCIDVVESDARGDSAGDVDESAAGRGQLETEWSHAYVAMGLLLSHRSQTALLARVYNLDLAVCFVRAIYQVLRVPVREGAISASEDDAGQELRAAFVLGLASHELGVEPRLGGQPLRDVTPAEAAPCEHAASLAGCEFFLYLALGTDNLTLIQEVLATDRVPNECAPS